MSEKGCGFQTCGYCMIVMLDTSHKLERCSQELGGLSVEQLLTPLTFYRPQQASSNFAIDNGAFAGFDERRFLALLSREQPRKSLCRFVTAPDVVGNARATMELFLAWCNKLSAWPLAFVCQDEQAVCEIPLDRIQAIFIGGSTQWKMGEQARDCICAAKAANKWVHVGRVNTVKRFAYFLGLGADSVDGTGLSRFSWMRHDIRNFVVEGKITYSRFKTL